MATVALVGAGKVEVRLIAARSYHVPIGAGLAPPACESDAQ
jgi:hypothetical protein